MAQVEKSVSFEVGVPARSSVVSDSDTHVDMPSYKPESVRGPPSRSKRPSYPPLNLCSGLLQVTLMCSAVSVDCCGPLGPVEYLPASFLKPCAEEANALLEGSQFLDTYTVY